MDDTKDIAEIKTIDAPEYIIYMYLKLKLLLARVVKSIGKSSTAHDLCNYIIMVVKNVKDLPPKKFWMSACKAAVL